MRGVERRDGVEHGVDIGTRALDILLERFDGLLRPRVFVAGFAGQRRGFFARRGGFGRGKTPAFEGQLFGFAPSFELLTFRFELLGPGTATSRPAAYRARSAAGGD